MAVQVKIAGSGRVYDIEITQTQFELVRTRLGVDLKEVYGGGELFTRLHEDDEFLVNVLYVLCARQCEAAKVTQEDFARDMVGDGLQLAFEALKASLVSFCRDPSKRAATARALEKSAAAQQVLYKAQEEWIGPAMDEALQNVLRQMSPLKSSEPSGSVPASSGSTPALSP